MNAAAYLRRMHTAPVVRADAPTLFKLQRAHLQSVPFENLDIGRCIPLSLDHNELFDKIVTRRRGGICYELNVLFAWLLTVSGFDVSLLAAEVHGDDGTVGPAFDHLALLAHVGGQRFLVDVGFGDSFLEPLDIDLRGRVEGASSGHSVRKDGEHHVVMQRRVGTQHDVPS